MLEKLVIEGFQKHRLLTVEFDPHITTIVGHTDSGKSAILRALLWLMTNQPRGDFFIRHGQDAAKVSLWLDGHLIQREKGKGRNSYQLDKGNPYEAFGTGVPDEISNLINICSANIQRQLDAPFLLSLTPGEASRELNSVVNLDLIDSVLSTLSGDHKKAKTLLQVSEDRLEQARHKKQDLEWIKQADLDYQEIELLEEAIAKERDEKNDLQSLIDTLVDIDDRMNTAGSGIRDLEDLVQAGDVISKTRDDVEDLTSLLDQIKKINNHIEEVQEDISSQENALRERLDGKCPICGSDREVQL